MKYLFIVSAMVLVISCGPGGQESDDKPLREYSIQSLLWQQNAAEYRALAYQSYNLARLQLDKILTDQSIQNGSHAIVTDIDETVLDNSPFNGKLIELDQPYSRDLWLDWGNLSRADTIPGALEFFSYAANKGIDIYYISNRLSEQLQVTINNLQKFGFPFADESHVLLRSTSSGKESRRQKVSESHKIIMLLGDNLSDFSDLFDRQGTGRRNFLVDSLKSAFGSRFIVFPNPMYGDWESKGIYEGRYDWSPGQLDSLRRGKIRAY